MLRFLGFTKSFMCAQCRLTTKLSDSRRRATVERTVRFQITRDSQTESAAAVRCSALVSRRLHGLLNEICPNSARQEVRGVATPRNSLVAYPSADTKKKPVML